MRRIETTSAFRRDFKRMQRTPIHRDGEALLAALLRQLVADEPPPPRNRDHALSGEWSDHRECHIKPDLLLVYRKAEATLQLVRLGSHSDLFGR